MFNSIKEDRSCDILIIGGGLAGLLTAREIAGSEKDIIIAEKRSIGSGRTAVGKDVVFTDGGLSLETREDVNIKEIAEEFAALTDELESICEEVGEKSFKRRGLFIFSDRSKERANMRRRFSIERLSNRNADFLTSDIISADFSFDFDSGVYTEQGGATVNAKALAEKMASYLSLNGIFIAENTEIKSLVPSAKGFTAKTEGQISIFAKEVIDTRCFFEKRAVLSAKTAPTESDLGWPLECIIRDTYKNRMTFYRTSDKKIGMTYEKPIILPQIIGSGHKFEYMQQILSSMFFAIPNTMLTEKDMIFEERASVSKTGILRSPEFENLYMFKHPYANGILSAIKGAKSFGSIADKGRK